MRLPHLDVPVAQLVTVLRRSALFGALPGVVLSELVAAARVLTLRPKDFLWHEGDAARALGVVIDGRLAVERTSRSAFVIDVLGAGGLLGEVALALGGAYQFDVRSIVSSRVLMLPTGSLKELFARSSASSVALAAELSGSVLRISRRLEVLAMTSAPQRLANVLADLLASQGSSVAGGQWLPLGLRRTDLARMAATTVETVSRQLGVWTRCGVLEVRPSGLLIRDAGRLQGIADGVV